MVTENGTLDSPLGTIHIGKCLGSGGQGSFFLVKVNSETLGLKWFYDQECTDELKKRISSQIFAGSPAPSFLWPRCLVEKDNTFGYVRELYPNGYHSLCDWVSRKFDMNPSLIIKACAILTEGFHLLHAKGLCYKDISYNNIYINPTTGDIKIIDTDNITANNTNTGDIIGTPNFLAPELVNGKSQCPNADTDRFSLAILLFHLLFVYHPFWGLKYQQIHCLDAAAMKALYSRPVFIFDPRDSSNRPFSPDCDAAVKLWENLWPSKIKTLFVRAFTEGIADPSKRPMESEWRNVFFETAMDIFACPHCHQEYIYDIDKVKANNGVLPKCLVCQMVPFVPRLRIGNLVITLTNNRSLIKRVFSGSYEDRDVIGKISNNGRVFLFNTGAEKITLKHKDTSAENEIGPKESAEIFNGDQICYLGKVGEVRF